METAKATELVCVIFAKMNRAQRLALIKLLKVARSKLDLNYPNGVPEKEPPKTSSLILPPGVQ